MVSLNHIRPSPNALIIRASAVAELVPLNEVIDGQRLIQNWQAIVHATHPLTGDPRRDIDPSVFDPVNLDDFLAIRCRAVSSMEVYSANSNGDAFPASELIKAHHLFVGKGLYKEHDSSHPRNAIGVIIHSQWMDGPTQQFVETIPVVDRTQFPRDADRIRQQFREGTFAVSLGCIAGRAKCSRCGNIATSKLELCSHVDRGNPACLKGKRRPGGGMEAYDINYDLLPYELSHVYAPADAEAKGRYVHGAVLAAKEDDVVDAVTEKGEKPRKEEGRRSPMESQTLEQAGVPDDAELKKITDDVSRRVTRQRVVKLVKTKYEQEMAPLLKQIQLDLKPRIEELVEEKRDAVKEAVR